MTAGLFDNATLGALVEMIGRTGARSLEFGYHPMFDDDGNELDDATAPASAFRWWAKATYKGAMLAVDDLASPVDALVALEAKVRSGAACRHCRRPIDWGGRRRRHCWWTRQGERWEPGCRPSDRPDSTR